MGGPQLRTLAPAAAVAVLAIMIPPLVVPNSFYMHLLVLAGLFAALASSLNLVMGYSGLLSLGHQAFFGLGAYTSALLSLAGVPLGWALMASAVVPLVCARVIGAVLLKTRGAFFVIATIAFAEVLRLVSLNWVDVTRGPAGITGIPPLHIDLPLVGFIDLSDPYLAYYPVAFLAVGSVLLCAVVARSRVGSGLIAMRESEYVARALSIDTDRYALTSVIVAAAIAGLTGAMYGYYLQFVSPDVFNFGNIMVPLVVMVLAGGMGTLAGPVIGAVIFTITPELLRASNEFRLIIYGVLIVLFVRFIPGGFVGIGRTLARVVAGRKAPTPAAGSRHVGAERRAVAPSTPRSGGSANGRGDSESAVGR